VQRTAVFL